MPTVRTVAAPVRHEIPKIKGSRFIASVARADSAESALAFVERLRDELRDATHHCFAWRVGSDENAFRYSDDGEPSGTAGRPILQEIDGRRLTDVVVVVTRYYGGTKLGTGGLLRAYAQAASEALDRAGVSEREVTVTLRLTYGYELTGAVRGTLAAYGLEPEKAAYGAEVQAEVAVPIERRQEVAAALRDATNGKIGMVDA